jgi:hypothetical protein
MSQIAVKDSNWIEVSSWEASQPYFVDLGAVTRQITEFISQNVEMKYTAGITVFYLCGAGMFSESRNRQFCLDPCCSLIVFSSHPRVITFHSTSCNI